VKPLLQPPWRSRWQQRNPAWALPLLTPLNLLPEFHSCTQHALGTLPSVLRGELPVPESIKNPYSNGVVIFERNQDVLSPPFHKHQYKNSVGLRIYNGELFAIQNIVQLGFKGSSTSTQFWDPEAKKLHKAFVTIGKKLQML